VKKVFIILLIFYNVSFAADRLTVATPFDFLPFSFIENGELVGFDIDFLKAISKDIGVELDFMQLESSNVIPAVASYIAEIGAGGVSISDERRKIVDYSIAYFDSGFVIFTSINDRLELDINNLANKKVGFYLNSIAGDFLKNVKVGQIVRFVGYNNMIGELLRGGVDAIFVDMPYAMYAINRYYKKDLKITGPLYFPHSYGFVFQKNSHIRKEFDRVIEELRFNGTYKKIYVKWFNE
jgi:glutamine transport system substrate-binding protein